MLPHDTMWVGAAGHARSGSGTPSNDPGCMCGFDLIGRNAEAKHGAVSLNKVVVVSITASHEVEHSVQVMLSLHRHMLCEKLSPGKRFGSLLHCSTSVHFGSLGGTILRGSPVRALRNAMRSPFSSAVRLSGFISGLRCGLAFPPLSRKSTTSTKVLKTPSCI